MKALLTTEQAQELVAWVVWKMKRAGHFSCAAMEWLTNEDGTFHELYDGDLWPAEFRATEWAVRCEKNMAVPVLNARTARLVRERVEEAKGRYKDAGMPFEEVFCERLAEMLNHH